MGCSQYTFSCLHKPLFALSVLSFLQKLLYMKTEKNLTSKTSPSTEYPNSSFCASTLPEE